MKRRPCQLTSHLPQDPAPTGDAPSVGAALPTARGPGLVRVGVVAAAVSRTIPRRPGDRAGRGAGVGASRGGGGGKSHGIGVGGGRERGSAVVEFVVLGLVLLVPLLYVALALSAVQRTAFGVTQAAREAGRAYVTGTAVTAPARAAAAARLALADQGVPADGVQVRYGAAATGCAAAGPAPWPLRPGEVFAVCVTAPLPLPAVPGFLRGDHGAITGRHVVRADEHRDHQP